MRDLWDFVDIRSPQVLAGRQGNEISSIPCVSEYIINLESFNGGSLLQVLLVVLKNDLLLLLLLFDHLLVHSVHLGEVDHALAIGKGRNRPLSFLVAPGRVVEDVLELILIHEHVHYGRVLLYLFLLVSDSVKQFFLFLLVLALQIFELDEVEGVLLLYLLETLPHLVHLFIEILVVFLYVKQLLLSSLFFPPELFLLLLLLL